MKRYFSYSSPRSLDRILFHNPDLRGYDIAALLRAYDLGHVLTDVFLSKSHTTAETTEFLDRLCLVLSGTIAYRIVKPRITRQGFGLVATYDTDWNPQQSYI
jgi:hypothetical protein